MAEMNHTLTLDSEGVKFLHKLQEIYNILDGNKDRYCGCADCESLRVIKNELATYLGRWERRQKGAVWAHE